MILFLLSLLAGFLTVLAPCTISLLPVIVGGSLTGEHSLKRALVVTTSLGVSVIVFTLLLKVSTSLVAIPQGFWQLLSGGIILALGLTMLFPSLWDRVSFARVLNVSSNRLLAVGYQKQNFIGDVLIGTALGPVFSSCSPTYFLILATVLPRSIAEGVVYLLAYTVALCGGLLVVTLAGQKILQKCGVASDPKGWLKRSIGVLFILLGIAITFGYEKKLELFVASHVFDVTQIEQYFLLQEQSGINEKPTPENGKSVTPSLPATQATDTASATNTLMMSEIKKVPQVDAKAKMYTLAPEIVDPSGFVNTDGKPITFGEFKGKKVVLVDFWTYSCINCQRTLPYLKAWYDKYHDQGLEIISIHTPEFGFEKVQKNVENAVQDFGLKYPVVLDNNYSTWNAFGNQFWPRKYLIDIDGYIVYDHAGEGSYDVTEQAIQKALQERADRIGTQINISSDTATPSNVTAVDTSKVKSPETYFGSERNSLLANGDSGVSGLQTLTVPATSSPNMLYLGGTWDLTPEYAESKGVGSIVFEYDAKNVYITAGSSDGVEIEVYKDNVLVKKQLIKDQTLYPLIEDNEYGSHTLKIVVPKAGLQAFTFTFG